MLSLDPSRHSLDKVLNGGWIVAYGVVKLSRLACMRQGSQSSICTRHHCSNFDERYYQESEYFLLTHDLVVVATTLQNRAQPAMRLYAIPVTAPHLRLHRLQVRLSQVSEETGTKHLGRGGSISRVANLGKVSVLFEPFLQILSILLH